MAAVETKAGIQYLTNEAGEKTGVLIPIEMWEDMEQIFAKYQEMQRIKDDIVESIKEYKAMQRDEEPVVTLEEFLKEL